MSALLRAPAVLTVYPDAVAANWRLLRDKVAPGANHQGTECSAVVKADAYGLGAELIAPRLYQEGCRTFFVATIDEGISLRRVLPDGAIMVLGGPLPGSEGEFLASRLTPVLNSLGQVALWSAFAQASGGREAVLHVDTGMTRLGLEAHEVASLVQRPELLDGVFINLLQSHMACADEPDAAMNPAQLQEFERLCAGLPAARRSLAASSTIFLGPAYHFDLVRPGAALYGVNPHPGQPNPMSQVLRLEAKILQVRDVDSPMTVGYGATHRIAAKGRIATAAVGYADGLLRSLGNRGHGIIGGIRVPVVGRISMDLTTFDVSSLPEGAVRPGDMVEIIGPGHTVDELAREAGTIGYEILTALGRRYHRVVGDGLPC
jgi:alanine racemase